ncbi:hypothetical protein OTU49_017375 [Cherax quadricarinatus]|uniref:Uncharacterized protein n=1 Tax=Cherax quadricarinatus TaxID=27406 RepID=A0AAW0XTR6_CHEQU
MCGVMIFNSGFGQQMVPPHKKVKRGYEDVILFGRVTSKTQIFVGSEGVRGNMAYTILGSWENYNHYFYIQSSKPEVEVLREDGTGRTVVLRASKRRAVGTEG